MPDEIDYAAAYAPFGETEVERRTAFQKTLARAMSASTSTIPHVTHHDDVDVTGLEVYRASLDPSVRLSPLLYIVKAVADALATHPRFNASLSPDGDVLILKKYVNIGIAVDSPRGLMVPVLRECDRKDMQALGAELKELSTAAREKGLPYAAMTGGGFTISSLGGIGGTYFTPVINAPEVAILGVTGIQTRPVWDGADFQPRQILPLSLSYDHRVINGADAARFVKYVGASLAKWGAQVRG